MLIPYNKKFPNNDNFNTGGIAISQNLLCKGLEMTKIRAKSVRSVINTAISTLNINNIDIDIDIGIGLQK